MTLTTEPAVTATTPVPPGVPPAVPVADATPPAADPPSPADAPARPVAHRTFPVQTPNGVVRVVAGSPEQAVGTARALYGLPATAPVTVVEQP